MSGAPHPSLRRLLILGATPGRAVEASERRIRAAGQLARALAVPLFGEGLFEPLLRAFDGVVMLERPAAQPATASLAAVPRPMRPTGMGLRVPPGRPTAPERQRRARWMPKLDARRAAALLASFEQRGQAIAVDDSRASRRRPWSVGAVREGRRLMPPNLSAEVELRRRAQAAGAAGALDTVIDSPAPNELTLSLLDAARRGAGPEIEGRGGENGHAPQSTSAGVKPSAGGEPHAQARESAFGDGSVSAGGNPSAAAELQAPVRELAHAGRTASVDAERTPGGTSALERVLWRVSARQRPPAPSVQDERAPLAAFEDAPGPPAETGGLRGLVALAEASERTRTAYAPPSRRGAVMPRPTASALEGSSAGGPCLAERVHDERLAERIDRLLRAEARRQGIDVDGVNP